MEHYQLTLPDYLAILKRRGWLIAGGIAVMASENTRALSRVSPVQ